MATVTYDARSFAIDGRRIWLSCGEMHYFRIPSALWADRLLKAKRAGLNCINTCVAWNFHESEEGKWDFSGDRDVAAFVQQAAELGLYVILRPGPYISAEWDFGGLPAWLSTKSGVSYRTNNAAFTHYYDKYFRQVLPRLAEHQVTHGGNIVLIQNESEYTMTTMPDRLAYLEFISQLFQRSGFDIPIITCNHMTEPFVPEAIECYNGRSPLRDLKRLRAKQPGSPLLVAEYYPGGFDCWGGEHHGRDAREVARNAMEILGNGAQYTYYMWHGGTNFGFWGSQLNCGDGTYQTTSYDFDAPLAEGGGLTEKYYLTRLVNVLADSMGAFFAECTADTPGADVLDGTNMLNLSGKRSRWAIVTNGGRDEIETADISMTDGRVLTVPLYPFGAAAVPSGLKLTDTHTLDYANVTPLGLFGGPDRPLLVLHGPAKWPVELSINDRPLKTAIPAKDEPELIEHEGRQIMLITSELAMKTWPVDGAVVFGADFVGDSLDDVTLPRLAKQHWVWTEDGKLSVKRAKPAPAAKKPVPPRLGSWSRLGVCTEPVSDDLEWKKTSGPKDMDHLGAHYGYAWYRIEVDEPRAKRRTLFLPDCEDRATLYLNGKLLGTWGRGDGAKRDPIGASFKKGKNVLVALVDNMGRRNAGADLGAAKGIFGHIHDGKPLKTLKPKLKPAESFPKRVVPRHWSHMLPILEKLPVWSAEVAVKLTKVTPIHLSFTDVRHNVAVLCNDRVVDFFEQDGAGGVGDVTLNAELKKGKNVVTILLWGDVDAATLAKFRFHTLAEPVTDKAAWSFRPWTPPGPDAYVVGKDQPAWYVTKFKWSDAAAGIPLFLRILAARKGQIYLNGHNVGRFWNIGPQDTYYLPECWLKPENELMIFEESGTIPARSRLEFCPQGPYRE